MEYIQGFLFTIAVLFLIVLVGAFVVYKVFWWAAGRAIEQNRRK